MADISPLNPSIQPDQTPEGSQKASKKNHPSSFEAAKENQPEANKGSGGLTMTEFMAMLSPEDQRRFMNNFVLTIIKEMERQSKRSLEKMKEQRKELEEGG
jgi:hypothetical protein